MNSEAEIAAFLVEANGLIREARLLFNAVPNVRPASIVRLLLRLRHTLDALEETQLLLLDENGREGLLDVFRQLILMGEHIQHNLAPPAQQEREPVRIHAGRRGQPRHAVDIHNAIELYNLGNSWKAVAATLGTSRRTLFERIRQLPEQERPYVRHNTTITDEELDAEILAYKLRHPYVGSSIIRGYLKSIGLNVPLNRIKTRVRGMDRVGNARRWARTARRRAYHVRGANYLWHFDANEKLRPWGFEIHGGIDGKSRLVLWTEVRWNKRADTVASIFDEARRFYGWPVRVRADYGQENLQVGRLMIEEWGEAHNAFLRGWSIQNIRIERWWRDVRKDSTEFFRVIFIEMVSDGVLVMDLRSHRLCLYLTFVDRVQAMLDESRASWNEHGLSTERNTSPLALWARSREELIHDGMWPGDGGDENADVGRQRHEYDGDLAWAADLLQDFDFNAVDEHNGVMVFLTAVDLLRARAPEVDIVEDDAGNEL